MFILFLSVIVKSLTSLAEFASADAKISPANQIAAQRSGCDLERTFRRNHQASSREGTRREAVGARSSGGGAAPHSGE
jgi:hypothetical protein